MSFDIANIEGDSYSYGVTYRTLQEAGGVQVTFEWLNDDKYIPGVLEALKEDRDFVAPSRHKFTVKDKTVNVCLSDDDGSCVGSASFPAKSFISLIERIDEMSQNKELTLQDYVPAEPRWWRFWS